MPSLNESVALVSGANGGIGSELVHHALGYGAAKVYATASTPASGTTSGSWLDPAHQRPGFGPGGGGAAPDVTVLTNNAGTLPPTAKFLELAEADLRAGMETNFFGTVLLATAFAPVLSSHTPDRS